MDPVKCFMHDNMTILDDYILVKDKLNDMMCYFYVDDSKLLEVSFESYKDAGGKVPNGPVYLESEDFYVFREELNNV